MNSNEAVIALVEALDQTGIPYMIVGSFSSNAYGVVRSTKDADFMVPCPFADIARLVKELGPPWRFQPQIAFADLLVRAVTREALVRKDRPHVAIEVDLGRHLGRRLRSGRRDDEQGCEDSCVHGAPRRGSGREFKRGHQSRGGWASSG